MSQPWQRKLRVNSTKKGTKIARQMKRYVLKKITPYTCNVGTKTATSDKDGDKILHICSCIATWKYHILSGYAEKRIPISHKELGSSHTFYSH